MTMDKFSLHLIYKKHFVVAEKNRLLSSAIKSTRKRAHKILHQPGDYDNEVFNVMLQESYMQPHLHPSEEKIEHIYIIEGAVDVIFFENDGKVIACDKLRPDTDCFFSVVPAFAWHGYVIRSEYAITFETMQGIYSEETWKTFASWAPKENSLEAKKYLSSIKRVAETFY